MKRILGWLCIVAVLAMSMVSGTIVSLAETTNGSTVTNIYATGNWLEGEKVTAHYTTQDENVKIQWYRTGNLKDNTAIGGATSAEYTLQYDDAYNNFNSVYFTVTDSSGKVFYSPVYAVCRNTQATSKVDRAHLIIKNGENGFVPGVSVGIDHNTAFVNDEEGTHTYEWRIKDTAAATEYETVGTNDTYTINESDYGKYLEGAITVKKADGTTIATKTAIAYVGGGFDLDAVTIATSNFYQPLPLATTLWNHSEDFLYTKKAAASITIDATKSVRFDGFKLYVKNVGSGLKISYSDDNIQWYNLPLTGTLTGNIKQDYRFDRVYTARYFKVSFTPKSNNYGILYEAYPCLTAANKNAESIDIASIGYGAKVDNGLLSISNITHGIPADKLVESVISMKNDADISLTDASGEAVDAAGIILTSSNIANYRIKVAYENASQIYTLTADALKAIDISNMTDDAAKRYTTNEVKNSEGKTESTGYGKNILGTKATYWYSSAEYTNTAKETANLYPYAIREVVDGENAIAVHTNGNPADNSGVADIWYTATDLDEEGCYSFSFKVKPDSGSSIQVSGRPYHNLNTVEFVGGFVQLNTTGLFAHNGTEMERIADFAEDEWHNVEVVVDYKNMKKSVWVNGVNYVDGAELKFSSNTYNKTAFSMGIKILASPNGKDDVNYIKDIEFNRVWDVNTKLSADGEALGMKLYCGDEIAEAVSAGTYSAKGNGIVFSDKYFVAVYKVEYTDNTKSTVASTDMIGAYVANGRASAEITDIVVPESAYTETSDAMVKIFCWNNGVIPVGNALIIK